MSYVKSDYTTGRGVKLPTDYVLTLFTLSLTVFEKKAKNQFYNPPVPNDIFGVFHE